MAVSEADVRRVALLARLEVTDEEARSLTEHFGKILEHFHRLQELELSEVDPFSLEGPGTPWRSDEAKPWDGRDEILSEASRREGDFFVVPRIVEEE